MMLLMIIQMKDKQEINYKVCIDVVGDEIKKEIEIGELLFGLQPKEYSYIDTIMTNYLKKGGTQVGYKH